MVARMKATEQPFSGKYASGHFKGTFVCVCCGAKLFDASNKFESVTGWPSFWRPVSEKALDTAMDYSEPAEARVEVACHRCGEAVEAALFVTDLQATMGELGLDYPELVEICPRCKRVDRAAAYREQVKGGFR